MQGAKVNIDDFVNYEVEYKAYVKKVAISGGHMTGLCPFHEDASPSFSVDLKTGKWTCLAEDIHGNFLDFYARIHGTTTKEAFKAILEKYHIEQPAEQPVNNSYTLAQYAQDKKLPEKWLREICRVSTERERSGTKYVLIPYFNEDGSDGAARKRYARKQFKWKWGSQGKIGLYGEWRLKPIRESGYVVLVEGESDTQSLWYMGIPAIGVPGASMFQPRHAKLLDGLRVYLHQERDGGGEAFVKKVLAGLHEGDFTGEVRKFSCGDVPKCKDPSDVFMRCGKDDGAAKIAELMSGAEKVDLEVIPEAIKGAPINLRVPDGWEYNENGISRVDEKTGLAQLICRTPIILTGRLRGLDSGDEKIEVAFLRDGKWRKESFPRSLVFTSRGITALSDLGCTVTSENAKMVVRFLSALEADNTDIIPLVDSTSTYGWQSGGRFVPGVEKDIFLDIDPSQRAVASAYCQAGSLDGWIDTMRPHREKYKFRFILAASLAAPLLRIVRQRGFFLHNWGGSRTGKTAALKAALSAWGDADRLTMNFNATPVGLERTAAFFTDLPLGLDERQLVGDNQKLIEKIVYMISSGTGKLRGAKTGGVQQTSVWRTIAMTTGEEPLSANTSQTGIYTRVLEVYCGPFENEAEAAQMYKDVAENYGHAGPEFVRRIVSVSEDSIRRHYDRMQDFVKSIGSGKAGSHVASVAVIALADAMANEWLFMDRKAGAELELCAESWERACGMAKRIMEEQMSAATGDVNEQAIQFVTDWVLSNQTYFGEKAIGTCLGMMSDDGKVAYIYPSTLNSILKREGFNDRKTKKYMADNGIITSAQRKDNGGETYSITKRFQGKIQRFVEFFIEKAQRLDFEEEMEPDEVGQYGIPFEDDDLPAEWK